MLAKSTKGRTLSYLQERLSNFVVPECMLISCSQWKTDEQASIGAIAQCFGERVLVVRSSASDEDGESGARAGEYHSVLNVPATDSIAIKAAVSEVMDSYVKKGSGFFDQEVLVQEMVGNVVLSGVVFTHELNTGAPYCVINYDDI